MFHKLIADFSQLPQIEAIALGGSRAGEVYDESSDYDVYLYCNSPISEEIRQEILSRYCSHIEIGNHFWEIEDNCTFENGVDIDILYRNLNDFTDNLTWVVEKHQAKNGYTTCMWHNLLNCKVLYDPGYRLQNLKKRFSVPFPGELKRNIITRNRILLAGYLPSYSGQILKAVKRGDLISINHRSTAFFESYFDVIFALNERTHPGEKRLLPLALDNCPILPENFEENLESYFALLFTDTLSAMKVLDKINQNLQCLLDSTNW